MVLRRFKPQFMLRLTPRFTSFFNSPIRKRPRTELEEELQQLRDQLSKKDTQLSKKDTQLSKKDTQLKEKDTQLKEKDTQLSKKDTQLKAMEEKHTEDSTLLSKKDTRINADAILLSKLRAKIDVTTLQPKGLRGANFDGRFGSLGKPLLNRGPSEPAPLFKEFEHTLLTFFDPGPIFPELSFDQPLNTHALMSYLEALCAVTKLNQAQIVGLLEVFLIGETASPERNFLLENNFLVINETKLCFYSKYVFVSVLFFYRTRRVPFPRMPLQNLFRLALSLLPWSAMVEYSIMETPAPPSSRNAHEASLISYLKQAITHLLDPESHVMLEKHLEKSNKNCRIDLCIEQTTGGSKRRLGIEICKTASVDHTKKSWGKYRMGLGLSEVIVALFARNRCIPWCDKSCEGEDLLYFYVKLNDDDQTFSVERYTAQSPEIIQSSFISRPAEFKENILIPQPVAPGDLKKFRGF